MAEKWGKNSPTCLIRVTLVIAFLTLSFQTFKAARANPADTLREVG